MLLLPLKSIIFIFLILLLPGWAILSTTGYWRKWDPLQRWFLAPILGIVFWPVLYYTVRFVLPSVRLGLNKLAAILIICGILILIYLRKNWKEQFQLGKEAKFVLLVLFLTLLSRLIIAYQYPYLAGTDSVHHSLITDLVARNGQLPTSLLPFDSADLSHYHLGLYSLSGPLQLLADISAPQALLWFSQFINGLCGLGVFLLLDRKVSRTAGIIGMICVGLLSVYPSWFVNWGRFTQLSSQTILLPTALITWEAISNYREKQKKFEKQNRVEILIAGFLNAGVCLLHFRVAIFHLGLIVIIVIGELIRISKHLHCWRPYFLRVFLILVVTLFFILPTLLSGVQAYLAQRDSDSLTVQQTQSLLEQPYYTRGDDDTVRLSKESAWLLVVGSVGLLFGLTKAEYRRLSTTMIFWVTFLIGIRQLFRLDIPVLAFVNITAVLLVFYLPAGIGFGILIELVRSRLSEDVIRAWRVPVIGALAVVSLIGFYYRIGDVLESRIFMSTEDEKAMDWVKANTETEAVFGVNTLYLNPVIPFGTDAGYWLPVYAGRQTTALTLLASLSKDYQYDLERSRSMTQLYSTKTIDSLCEYGVDYLYSGNKPPIGLNDFTNIPNFENLDNVNKIYDEEGVQIYKICTNQ